MRLTRDLAIVAAVLTVCVVVFPLSLIGCASMGASMRRPEWGDS